MIYLQVVTEEARALEKISHVDNLRMCIIYSNEMLSQYRHHYYASTYLTSSASRRLFFHSFVNSLFLLPTAF